MGSPSTAASSPDQTRRQFISEGDPMTERLPYVPPAEPVVIGAIEVADNTYAGSGPDFGLYSSANG